MRTSLAALLLTLVGASGCLCDPGLTQPKEIQLARTTELRAVASSGTPDGPEFVLVDADGHVSLIEHAHRRNRFELEIVADVAVSSSPLVDVAVGAASVWVVGEGGVVFESRDAGQTWTGHPLDPGLEPLGVLVGSDRDDLPDDVLVWGEGFARAWSPDAGVWIEPELLVDGGWGSLRAGESTRRELVLSDGASLLVGTATTFGQRVDAPTEVVSLGGFSSIGLDGGTYWIGGRQGIAARVFVAAPQDWSTITWEEVDLHTDADVIAVDAEWALTDTGELIGLESGERLDVGDANAGLAERSDELVVFGTDVLLTTTNNICWCC